MGEKREFFGIHLIKCLAILFVVCFHFFYRTDYHAVTIFGWNLYVQTALRWLFHICVPLFFLSTGFLRHDTTFSKRYYRGVLRVVIPYLVISLITVCLRFLWIDGLNHRPNCGTVVHFLDLLLGILRFDAIGYGWFVGAFIALYLAIPLINWIWSKCKRVGRILLVCGLALFMWVDLFDFSMNLYPALYFLIGKMVREDDFMIPPEGGIGCLRAAAVFFIQLFVVIYVNNHAPTVMSYFDNYGSVLPVCFATLFFTALCGLREPNNRTLFRAVKFVSVSTFEIYLFLYVFDYVFYSLFLSSFYLPTQELKLILFLFVPALSFFCACACAFCYRRVSSFFVKKYRERKEANAAALREEK